MGALDAAFVGLKAEVDELRAQLWLSAETNAYLLAQTRFACDCLVQIITRGALPGVPWHDMDPNHVGDGSSTPPPPAPAEHIIVPNRAERRKAARDFINRTSGGQG